MRIEVLGAGIIGLACAEELTRRGHQVNVVDPAPGSGASHAAAGMLSPSAELWHGEEARSTWGCAAWRCGRRTPRGSVSPSGAPARCWSASMPATPHRYVDRQRWSRAITDGPRCSTGRLLAGSSRGSDRG